MRYLKSFIIFENTDYSYLKDADALDDFIREEVKPYLPDGVIIKIRKKVCNVSGFIRELIIKFREPNKEKFAKCEIIEFNDILPAIEHLNSVLKDFGLVRSSKSSSYFSYNYAGDFDRLLNHLKNTRDKIYTFEFKLKKLDTKKADVNEYLTDELFLCCVDRNIEVTTGVINGHLALKAHLNYNGKNVRSLSDPNFVMYDDDFYLEFSDSVHKFEKIYKLKLNRIIIEGQKKEEFSGAKMFRTLEEFEDYPKSDLKLTMIRVSFEL